MQEAEQKAIYQMSITPGVGFITGPEGEKAVKDVINQDKDCSYRLILNIVGKERQGKTSLRKLLSNDMFDENEESTVGVDHELVDTVGLQPDPSRLWSKLDIRAANSNEYDDILGKHLMIRLGKVKYRTLNSVFAPVIVCARIGLITWITFAIYSNCIVSETLQYWPWFGILLCFMFTFLIPFLGIADGTGIGVGIRHYVILIDAWFRWDLASWCLADDSLVYIGLSVVAVLFLFLVLESVESVALGQSMGIGIACCFCLCCPPSSDLYVASNPLQSPEIHLFILGCLIGLYLYSNCNYIIMTILIVVLAILFHTQTKYCICLTVSIAIGALHNHGIMVGQNLYCLLDTQLKTICSSRRSRRFVRHLIGIVLGLIHTRMFGWEFSPDIAKVFIVIVVVMLVEMFSYLKSVQRSKQDAGTINHPSKVIGARTRSPRLKLLVRDFAGHPLYYTAHHLYMTGQCVYLLVFSLVEASEDFQMVLQDILRWLRSIQLHSHYPQTRVFLVGTHRDDIRINKSAKAEIKEQLKRSVHRIYHNIIVWNDDDTPLFPVENSSRCPTDKDHKNLKDKIIKQTTDIILQEKFPVKFFFFFTIIEHYRKEQIFSEYFQNVYRLCKDMKLMLATESEFEEMLIFFHKMGEIMFRRNDNELKMLIIFDPRSLLNIVSYIINVPKMSERPPHLVDDWSILEERGICSAALFKHVFEQHCPTGIAMESAIAALSRFHLICKLNTSFIIPSSLPEELPYPEKCWSVHKKDIMVYIKCLPHFPQELFLHLLCACAEFDCSAREGNANMSRRKAIFTYDNQLCYQLEIFEDDKHGYLKIVLRGDALGNGFTVLLMIWQCLNNIVKQDFKMCKLMMGYLCPCTSPHEDGSKETHLLTIANNSEELESIPDKSNFWCCGRKVNIAFGQMHVISREDDPVLETKKTSVTDVKIKDRLLMEVPNHVYKTICDYLNPPNPLGHDWTMLAGLLDLTVRDVEMINFKNSNNPCSAVLTTWCNRQPDTKMVDLLKLLEKMERFDVVGAIENEEFL
ncbi:hypothetical protein SNE40_011410 [Patella caerulea]|uniref:Death domain-containing protein n=1 Tax=Patella caerulea TaxID=87958 RepID=A0AAN8JN28_PATCE